MHNEINHSGILGMKWGKKNGPPYPLSEAKHNAVVRTKTVKRYKRTDEMDDDTLKKATDRIKAENEYLKLVNERQAKERSRGKRFVESLKDHLVDDVSKTASKVAADYIDGHLRNTLGLPEKSNNNKKS